MKNNLPVKLLAFVSVIVCLATTPFVFAQTVEENSVKDTDLKLMAIPPRTEVISIAPGETKQFSIRLRNLSSTTQTIATETQDFIISDDGKTPIPITEQEAAPLHWSLAQWLTVAPTIATINPNQTALYNIVIQAPENALPGGHYAMILHQPTNATLDELNNKDETIQTQSSVSPKVGTLVYVVVKGNVKEEAFVRNFQGPQWVELGPVEMSFEIENLSDIHIAPQTKIEIKNFFGQTTDSIAVESANVFPYASRRFSATYDQVWGLGPYRAIVTAAYGSEGKIATATLSFWMIPYRLILTVLVVIISIIASIIVIRRHYLHRTDIKTKQIEILEERVKELERESKQQRG